MALSARFGFVADSDIVRSAECSSTDLVGECVCIVDDPPNGGDFVGKADPADFDLMPAVGIIIHKETSTSTECQVQWYGETPNIFAGLSSGEVHFVGVDSKISADPPIPTTVPLFAQFVGVATAPTRLYVRPNDMLIRTNP